jgi:DNA-binding MarR family transcriptional regulator
MNKTILNALSLMVDSNLTVREWYVLSLVQQNSGLSLIDLVPKQNLPKSTLGRMVSHLSSMGLVSALPDLTDYRRQVLMVTDKGIEQLRLLTDGFSQTEQTIDCSVPVDCVREVKAQALESLLSKCIYSEDHKVKIITESMIKHNAAMVRKGVE